MKILLVAFLFLSSCSYRLVTAPQTITIPYVDGDIRGDFTNTLIYKFSKDPSFIYTNDGDVLLSVCLLTPQFENVGFKFAPDSNILVSTETRILLQASVRFIDATSGCTLFGPCIVQATNTFDFESDFSNINFNRFSLGQLEMHNLAEIQAFNPLYAILAQKIVDVSRLQLLR